MDWNTLLDVLQAIKDDPDYADILKTRVTFMAEDYIFKADLFRSLTTGEMVFVASQEEKVDE